MHSEQTGIRGGSGRPGPVAEPDGLRHRRQQRRPHGQPHRHGQQRPDQRSARSAYDYLEDGHYSAGRTGKIRDRAGRAQRDFTQDVRDMLGDTEKAAKDIGQDVKNAGEKAAGDVTNAAKEAKNGVENTVKDATGYR